MYVYHPPPVGAVEYVYDSEQIKDGEIYKTI